PTHSRGTRSGYRRPSLVCVSPVSRCVPVSVTRWQVSKHLRVSQEHPVQRSPPCLDRVHLSSVPRRHQDYEGSKTSCVEYEVTYGFASSPQLFVSSFIPIRRRLP